MPISRILVFGNGFVASLMRESHTGDELKVSHVDVRDESALRVAFEEHAPDAVINTAAKTNIDWCESNKQHCFEVNTLGADRVAKLCAERSVYFVQLSSGCLQESRGPDDAKREDDPIDPLCFYAWTKAWAEQLIQDRVSREGLRALIIRPRLLVSARLSNRNSLLKLLTYSRFVDISQSATIAEDMIEVILELIARRATGVYNVANPGLISPWDIAQMLRETLDPHFEATKIQLEELNTMTQVRRIRSVLSVDRLRQSDIVLRDIRVGVSSILNELRDKSRSQEWNSVLALTHRETKAKLLPVTSSA